MKIKAESGVWLPTEATGDFKLVTVKGIPIVETGLFDLSTGQVSFTEEDLADAVLAAEEDDSVKRPRLKLGHVEGGWQAGEPSFGNFYNLRLSDDKQQILADLETVDWLAEIMPLAYPNRSIEGDLGWKSPTGHFYRFVIHAVSLLGVEIPGVTSLEDLRDLYINPEVSIVAKAGERQKPRVTIHAQVDAEDVRRKFMEVVAQGDRYWWWVRSMRLNPNELIAMDDETGDLFRIPFDINDRDVTFGDPVPVYVEYIDDPAKEQVAASWKAAASRRPSKQRGGRMDPKQLRQKLGLPEDATDEQVEAKLAVAASAGNGEETQPPPATPGQPTTAPDEGGDEEQKAKEQVKKAEEADTPPPDQGLNASKGGVVTVEAAAFDRLQQDAKMGREARLAQIKAEDDAVLDGAVRAGKFAPARREHFSKLMAADRQGTRQLIASLAENVIPVSEEGSGASTETEQVQAAYPDEWLTPAERARKQQHLQEVK